jgi:hypothetical protein
VLEVYPDFSNDGTTQPGNSGGIDEHQWQYRQVVRLFIGVQLISRQ